MISSILATSFLILFTFLSTWHDSFSKISGSFFIFIQRYIRLRFIRLLFQLFERHSLSLVNEVWGSSPCIFISNVLTSSQCLSRLEVLELHIFPAYVLFSIRSRITSVYYVFISPYQVVVFFFRSPSTRPPLSLRNCREISWLLNLASSRLLGILIITNVVRNLDSSRKSLLIRMKS